MSEMEATRRRGHEWRSSQAFIIFTTVLALYSETFLYAFIVPILSYMIEVKLRLPSSQTQWFTTTILSTYGLVTTVFAPIIAHFADKTPNRRTPLLLALVGCFVGTLLLAICSSVSMLFVGRIIQAISGSAGWIVAFATLTDNVAKDNIGKVLGTAMAFVTAGIITGPVLSGALLQLVGYWAVWSAPLVLLALGFITRLVMLENNNLQTTSASTSIPDEEDGTEREEIEQEGEREAAVEEQREIGEETALLPKPSHNESSSLSSSGFYLTVLSNVSNIVGLVNTVAFAIILSGFDAAIPLHLQRLFHWGPLPVGMIFLGLQVPGMILGPVVGWLRDRVALRYPATIGWILIALFLLLLGFPGSGVRWVDDRVRGQVVFITAMIGIGTAAPLVRGTGTFQLVAEINRLREENPSRFGPHGASSRIFSVTEVAMNLGTIIGPLLSGSLVEAFDFQHAVGALSVISLAVGFLSYGFLSRDPPKRS